MAGHSQFKNIMHRKGRQDKVKSKLFGKLAREITVSAKLGLADPAMNPRLRAAMLAARAENMPKDNIDRAIKKALGGDAENYDEIRYEGYGPGGVAVVVEVLTDNRNRTAGEVRAAFTKSGGNLAETGAVSFMFDHVGVVEYDAGVASAERSRRLCAHHLSKLRQPRPRVQPASQLLGLPRPVRMRRALSPRRLWFRRAHRPVGTRALRYRPSQARQPGARRQHRRRPHRLRGALHPPRLEVP